MSMDYTPDSPAPEGEDLAESVWVGRPRNCLAMFESRLDAVRWAEAYRGPWTVEVDGMAPYGPDPDYEWSDRFMCMWGVRATEIPEE